MRDIGSRMVDVGSMVGRGLSRTPQVISVGEHFATKTTFMDPHLQQNIHRMWKEASLDSNPIKMMVPCIPQARLFHMRTYITVCMNIYLYTLRCWGSAGHTREGVGGGGVGMIYIYIYINTLIYRFTDRIQMNSNPSNLTMKDKKSAWTKNANKIPGTGFSTCLFAEFRKTTPV